MVKRDLKNKLEVLLEKDRDDYTLEDLINMKIGLNLKIDKTEMFWEQRAHVNLLWVGDKNTAFYHKFASQRKRINRIRELQKDDGSMIYENSELEHSIRDYFFKFLLQKGAIFRINY